ncbi:hypothetical protein HanRHA438_Chr14g0677901 [Helianthus annuus]|nr:hypothetical protein HanRHA438_Chr14g0677901 [Helianthus annuus]
MPNTSLVTPLIKYCCRKNTRRIDSDESREANQIERLCKLAALAWPKSLRSLTYTWIYLIYHVMIVHEAGIRNIFY